MRAIFVLIGGLVFLAGIVMLVHPRWASPSSKSEVEIDNHKVIFENTKYTEVPKAWSAVAIVVGGALLFVGARKPRS
ncbi:MAG TPA: hypothetical protein VJR23_10770 [Candidatus Acidoferrales bacterium]|nr:hypothetical protein [Candidatus Acidoferrales bacterium]